MHTLKNVLVAFLLTWAVPFQISCSMHVTLCTESKSLIEDEPGCLLILRVFKLLLFNCLLSCLFSYCSDLYSCVALWCFIHSVFFRSQGFSLNHNMLVQMSLLNDELVTTMLIFIPLLFLLLVSTLKALTKRLPEFKFSMILVFQAALLQRNQVLL